MWPVLQQLIADPTKVEIAGCCFELEKPEDVQIVRVTGLKFQAHNGLLRVYSPAKIWTRTDVLALYESTRFVRTALDTAVTGSSPVQDGAPDVWDRARFGRVVNVHDYFARLKIRVHPLFWAGIAKGTAAYLKQGEPKGGFSGNDLCSFIRRWVAGHPDYGEKHKILNAHTAYIARVAKVVFTLDNLHAGSRDADGDEGGKDVDEMLFVEAMIAAKELMVP